MMLKYFLKSGAFLEEGVRSLISRSISMIFRTVAGHVQKGSVPVGHTDGFGDVMSDQDRRLAGAFEDFSDIITDI